MTAQAPPNAALEPGAVAEPTPPLPAGTLLLHIGPPKTGTSSLQVAFHACRAETLAQGVRYAGRTRHSGGAVLALLGRRAFNRDSEAPPRRTWRTLVDGINRATEPRVLLSSEFFADAEPADVARAVADLGRDRLHVVVTLRPLDRLIPSQWQQYVQSDMRVAYDDWLRETLESPPGPTPTFWRRHRHDELVARWADVVGPERMTIVVGDDRDHDHILRVFEQLLGLRSGTLVGSDDVVNRSMTWPEIEAVRAFNVAFRDTALGNALFHRAMHFGAAARMKWRPPDASEARIRLPDWAREPVAGIADEIVENLRGTGIRVLGDLDSLRIVYGTAPASNPDGSIPPAIAAELVVGLAMLGPAARSPGTRRSDDVEGDLRRFSAMQLGGSLFGRSRRALAAARRTSRPASAVPVAEPWPAAVTATLGTIERRLDDAGVHRGAGARLRTAWPAAAAAALARTPEAAPTEDDTADGAVPPPVVGALGLAMLEATGTIRRTGGRSGGGPGHGGRYRAARWWWLEPPELARARALDILRIVPGRVIEALRRQT